MIKFIFLCLFSVVSWSASLSLYDLGFFVSKQTNKTVIFSHEVDQTVKVVYSSTPLDYLPLFKMVLKSNNYILRSDHSFIYVDVPKIVEKKDSGGVFGGITSGLGSSSSVDLPETLFKPQSNVSSGISVTNNGKQIYNVPFSSPSRSNSFSSFVGLDDNVTIQDDNISFQSFKLVYLNPLDIENVLKFSGFDYSISKNSKTIVFKVPERKKSLFDAFVLSLQSLDVSRSQITLKITVYSANDSKLRDLGFSPLFNLDTNFSLNSLGSVFSGSLIGSFYSSLHLMDSKGLAHITDQTNLFCSDNDTLDFKSVISMPVLDTNYVVTSTTGTNQTVKHVYKDIGYKVSVTPTIVNDVVYLDLNISSQNVVSGGELPVYSDKTIKNKFSLHRGDMVVLAGISTQTLTTVHEAIPFLSDIPYIGQFFTHNSKSNEDQTFNISIEVLK
jgi:type II secretory pathway component GspD/PulD (secretin)